MLYFRSRWPGHLLIIWRNFLKRHNKKFYKCVLIIWSLLEFFSRPLNRWILEYTAIIDGIIKIINTITIDFFRLYEMELTKWQFFIDKFSDIGGQELVYLQPFQNGISIVLQRQMHFSFENDVVSFKFLVNFTEVGKKSPCSYLFTSSLSRNSCKVNLPPYSSVSSEKFVRFVPVQTDLDKYGLAAWLNLKI